VEFLRGGIDVMEVQSRGMLIEPAEPTSPTGLVHQLTLDLAAAIRNRFDAALRAPKPPIGAREEHSTTMHRAVQKCLLQTGSASLGGFPLTYRSLRLDA
jgi:hypothetical protein